MRTDVDNNFILLCMLFLHIVDDFYLQGILANLKQKAWWQEHYPNALYRYDYVVALVMHAASWGFLIHLPLAYVWQFNPPWYFYAAFVTNVIVHAVVDNEKANRLNINLLTDQLMHIVQVFVTWVTVIRLPN